MPPNSHLFRTFLQAGFECSTHLNSSGRRLDLLSSTQHDRYTREDFDRLLDVGIRSVRVAPCWHKIETAPGVYDFHSVERYLNIACEKGIEVVLDILHFGWPDFIDVFSPDFSDRLLEFTRHLLDVVQRCDDPVRFVAPVNEISYLAWAGGEVGCIGPHQRNRGHELKRNLIHASARLCGFIRAEMPHMRLIAPEPVIHIIGDPDIPGDEEEAHAYTNAMYESWDMISGRMAPECGGRPEFLDIVGINFYQRNEWVHNSKPITRDHPRWRPFQDILFDVWQRYRRPMFIAETGTEDDERAGWFRYVCSEVRAAIVRGVPIHGICLYPILNHPGWDDDRHCCNGLFDYADENGHRERYEPLAEAILAEQQEFESFFGRLHEQNVNRLGQNGSALLVPSEMGLRVSETATSDEPVCTGA